MPSMKKPFLIFCDASGQGLGCVIMPRKGSHPDLWKMTKEHCGAKEGSVPNVKELKDKIF
jgi:hypothetical protein